jgi:hypothetical protein
MNVESGVSVERPKGRQTVSTLISAIQNPAASAGVLFHGQGNELFDVALLHDLHLLVGWTLRTAGMLDEWPPAFTDAFRTAEREAVAVDCAREADLVNLLAALDAAGVRVMPFKGAALSYTHYPAPHVRPRGDTDILVPIEDLPKTHRVLAALGYVRPPEVSGELVSYQCHYHRRDHLGITHTYDVHWRISNVQSLSNRLAFDELWNGRVPVRSLGLPAVTPNAVHSLMLALVHRAGHHHGSRRLLWLYDLHVIAGGLTAGEWIALQELSDARSLGEIARHGLLAAQEWFGPAGADRLVSGTDRQMEDARIAAAASDRRRWSHAGVLRSDLRALPDWRARARLLQEHLFPSVMYMRARYGVQSNVLIPALYLWRIIRGAPKWLSTRAAND